MSSTYFGMIVYPESTTEHDLMEGLEATGLPYAWAYHDRDTYGPNSQAVKEGRAKAGDPEKPHWHVLFYDQTARKSWTKLLKDLNGCGVSVKHFQPFLNKDGTAGQRMHEYLGHETEAAKADEHKQPYEVHYGEGVTPEVFMQDDSSEPVEEPVVWICGMVDSGMQEHEIYAACMSAGMKPYDIKVLYEVAKRAVTAGHKDVSEMDELRGMVHSYYAEVQELRAVKTQLLAQVEDLQHKLAIAEGNPFIQ